MSRRASDREDPTASALLDRAARLVRPHRLDLALELEAAWGWSEEDVRAAIGAANAAAERAEAAGDSSGAMLARAAALSIGTFTGDVGRLTRSSRCAMRRSLMRKRTATHV